MPTLHQVIGRQTSVLVVDTEVTHEPAPATLDLSSGVPVQHLLSYSLMDKGPFAEVQVSREVLTLHIYMNLNTLGWIRGTV